ncbi:HAD-IIA family hydrolase [Sulfurovum sp. NBC37-1]|uniref:HAD-IIA family hydrolase n=1 Tax=Sulfurovum sp. (strain NBC37-1) TaxID=387093 RepID=UPI0002F6576B|nr:HAD-IA family hydrolase [Sulfurovum sp. NBC37-1]
MNFTFERLNGAFRALQEGAELIAAAKNRYFKDSDGKLSMDAGGFIAALEFAAGTEAILIGKPSSDFSHLAAASMGLRPDEVLMIGDDIESDVKGAQDAGMKAALVKTGKFQPDDLEKGIKADFILVDVKELPSVL